MSSIRQDLEAYDRLKFLHFNPACNHAPTGMKPRWHWAVWHASERMREKVIRRIEEMQEAILVSYYERKNVCDRCMSVDALGQIARRLTAELADRMEQHECDQD